MEVRRYSSNEDHDGIQNLHSLLMPVLITTSYSILRIIPPPAEREKLPVFSGCPLFLFSRFGFVVWFGLIFWVGLGCFGFLLGGVGGGGGHVTCEQVLL